MVFEPSVADLVWKRSYGMWRWRDVVDVAAAGLPQTLVFLLVAAFAILISAALG